MRNARWRLRAGLALKDPWFTLNVRAHAREGAGPLTWHADHPLGVFVLALPSKAPLCVLHASAVLIVLNDHRDDHDDHQ